MEPARKGPSPARRWLVPAAAAILLAAGAAAVRYLAPPELRAGLGKIAASAGGHLRDTVVYWSDLTDPAPAPPLGLRVLPSDGELLVRWDPSLTILRDATGAVVEVTGGGQTDRHELSRAQLLAGSVTHARRPGDAAVRLTVLSGSGEAYLEGTWHLARAPGPEQPSGEAAQAELTRLNDEVRLLEQEERLLETRLGAVRKLALPRGAEAGGPAPARRPLPAAPAVTPPRGTASPPAAARTSSEPVGAAGQVQASRPVVPPSGEGGEPTTPTVVQPPRTAILRAVEPPPSAGPTAPQEPARPLVSSPRSGRLIWSGMLAPDQVLTIDAGRPSFGSMAGRLPGGAVRVAVYSAELGGGGLTVFTADPARAGGAAAEPAGPRNSWMATTWRYDVQQAQTIQVVEPPRAENGWQRLSLRAVGRAVTVVVVEWEAQ